MIDHKDFKDGVKIPAFGTYFSILILYFLQYLYVKLLKKICYYEHKRHI